LLIVETMLKSLCGIKSFVKNIVVFIKDVIECLYLVFTKRH